MTGKRVLIIDCQLLQTTAIHRGMGKYTLAVLEEYKKLTMPYDEIYLLFSSHASNSNEQEAVKKLKDFKVVYLPLGKTNPANPESYGDIAESNRKTIEEYIKSNLKGYSVDFFVTSIFHENGCSVFPSNSVNKYLLVYDLIPLQFPEYYLEDNMGRYQYLSRFSELFKASHYFTISKTVANDLSMQLGVSLADITPIDGAPISRAKLKQKQPSGFTDEDRIILMPTGDDVRKNNLRAASAFEEFNSKSGYAFKLVMTSFFGEKSKNELLLQSQHIMFTGNIEDEELAWLYSHADLILFPSEYEGLGMPPLEAVEFKVPVLCSSIDVFREISESAFNFCDPYNVDDISKKLQELLIDNKLSINSDEYKRILKQYSWSRTAKTTLEVFSASKTKQNHSYGKKKKIAIFAPNPSGYSAIGKVVQEQHYEISRFAEVDYYLESGVTEKAKDSNVRINYLPFVAPCKNPWALTEQDASKYDEIIYHVGNSEYHVASIVKALAFPSTVILHDMRIKGAFGIIRDLGYISESRFDLEDRLLRSIQEQSGSNDFTSDFIGSLVNKSQSVVVHSEYAESATTSILVDSENSEKIIKTNLPTPPPYSIYEAIESSHFTVGYAGVIHAAKGLDLIEELAATEMDRPIRIKIFGFSLVSEETRKKLDSLANVELIQNPSDVRFTHELEECDIVIGYRPDYHGETSLSTLETLRLGRPVIVNDVGWFKELPDHLVYKVKNKKTIFKVLEKIVKDGEKTEARQLRLNYIKEHHSTKNYINNILGIEI